MEKKKTSWGELILSFHSVNPRHQIQVIRVGSECLYPITIFLAFFTYILRQGLSLELRAQGFY